MVAAVKVVVATVAGVERAVMVVAAKAVVEEVVAMAAVARVAAVRVVEDEVAARVAMRVEATWAVALPVEVYAEAQAGEASTPVVPG
eukprot:4870961-Prymnesium_polylepis.1